MNDTVIPSLKMVELHAKQIRDALDDMDAKDPSVMMLKMLADDVIAEVGSAMADIEE